MAKKIKNVVIPIDERETFVSLQKNFAESEVSVEEKLKTLYELQKADSDIDKLLQLRGDLPTEVENLKNEVEALGAKIAGGEELIETYNQTISMNEQNIVDIDAQTEQYHSQLDNIANSREYDSISKEIENQGLLRQIAEKNITETRSAIFAKKQQISDWKERLAMKQEDLAAKEEELAQIVGSTSTEEDKLKAARTAVAAKIDERTLSAYDRIRGSVNNRLAVVGIYDGNACGGCFNTITAQRLIDIASCKKLVICEHCGRIIVGNVTEQ